ncbi:MAG: SGNH/GDSL hydrolase family protein [Lachnospiraceae bacterium]|nr:SGNH/GDSL hydrolase family protein [Lachnospiraceae bacterium]
MKDVIKTAVTAGVILLLLFFLQRLLMPKYMEGITEGAFIAEYYGEEKNHDVIVLGDCEVYENISPAVLWRDFGIHAYIRGSAQQTMWQSYYLLRETLTYETPKAVVLSVFAMQYDTPQNEAYNRMTLDGMRWSADKIDAVRASMLPEEEFIEYVFPLLRFHERWKELEAQDIRYLFQKRKVTHNGFVPHTGVMPSGELPAPAQLTRERFGENAMLYLERIRVLCEENNIPLILLKAPSLWPHWYDEWDAQIAAYADAHDLAYYNFLSLQEEIGLDFSTDTYDAGLHLNVYGAEKCATYLGGILQRDFGLADRRGEEPLSSVWEEKLEEYDRATETTP